MRAAKIPSADWNPNGKLDQMQEIIIFNVPVSLYVRRVIVSGADNTALRCCALLYRSLALGCAQFYVRWSQPRLMKSESEYYNVQAQTPKLPS